MTSPPLKPSDGGLSFTQLKELAKEYESAAEGQAAKLKELLDKERALQAAAGQLAAKRLQLIGSGQTAEVGSVAVMSGLLWCGLGCLHCKLPRLPNLVLTRRCTGCTCLS